MTQGLCRESTISTAAPRFAALSDLAREKTSEGRRDLLRTVTDMLIADGQGHSEEKLTALDDLLNAVAADFSTQVRVEIARVIANNLAPLSQTARRLAQDEIEVAGPVLRHARSLGEADLLSIITRKSDAHMLAVSERPDVNEKVSEALVEKGSDRVVVSLLENKHAKIAEETYEKVAERAEESSVLHAPFIRRQGVPMHLLNEIYLSIEPKLRQEVLEKFELVSKEELETALSRSRVRLSRAYGALPDDFGVATKRVDDSVRRRQLSPAFLITLLREGPGGRTAFILALSRLTQVDFAAVHRVVEARDIDALALLCRGADIERAVFVTIALTFDTSDNPIFGAETYGRMYMSVPVTAARRALHFWKARAQAA